MLKRRRIELRHQNEFATGARLHNSLVRSAGVTKWYAVSNNRLQGAVCQTFCDVSMGQGGFLRCDVEQSYACDVCLAAHDIAWIDIDFAPTADNNDSPVACDHLQVGGEIVVCCHFENDVGSAPAVDGENFVARIWSAMIEYIMRVLLFQQLTAFRRAAGSDNVEAAVEGDLDGGESDAAGGAMHQNCFALPGFGTQHQRAPGGRVRNAES